MLFEVFMGLAGAEDDAKRVFDHAALPPDGVDSVDDLATGGNDVFDEAKRFAFKVDPFDRFLGSVAFGFLADEDAWKSGFQRQGRDEGYTAQFHSGKQFYIRWQQPAELRDDGPQDIGIGFETVFVEIFAGIHTGSQDKTPGEVRCCVYFPA